MPADLDELIASFQADYERLLGDCRRVGKPMVCYYTVRHPIKQAKLWRQSRSRLEVETGISWLRGAGALWLAEITESVGPQFGRWATNCVAGNSWHQWGEAGDAYAEVDGRISWDTVPGRVGGPGDAYYRHYAARADVLGLTPLGPSIGDWPHVQARPQGAPSKLISWPEIDAEMRRRFGP